MAKTDNKITVTKIEKKYNSFSSVTAQQNYLKSLIKTTYAPIMTKKYLLQLVLDKSIVEQDNGIKYIDMFISKLNLFGIILAMYTNITIEKDKNGNPMIAEAYDMLKQINVIDELYNLIGEDEIEELLSVQKTIMDTFYNQNGSTEAFIANVVDKAAQKFGISAGFAIDKLDEIVSDEKKINKIMGIIKPFINKK